MMLQQDFSDDHHPHINHHDQSQSALNLTDTTSMRLNNQNQNDDGMNDDLMVVQQHQHQSHGGVFPPTPAFNQPRQPGGGHEHSTGNPNCCQVCYLEQTGGLVKMCPSVEGSLRELVLQVAMEGETNSNQGAPGATSQSKNQSMLGFSSQIKRLSELQDSIRHIFDGQAQMRKELDHLKLDLVGKSAVTREDLEQQLLLKANK